MLKGFTQIDLTEMTRDLCRKKITASYF